MTSINYHLFLKVRLANYAEDRVSPPRGGAVLQLLLKLHYEITPHLDFYFDASNAVAVYYGSGNALMATLENLFHRL